MLQPIISATPGLRGGQPAIDGTRITVGDIAILHLKLGQSPAEIAADYNLSLAAVYAALSHYFANQDAIDQRLAADDAYVAAFQQQHPSLLQQRLHHLQRASD